MSSGKGLLPYSDTISFMKALPLSSFTKLFTGIQGDYKHKRAPGRALFGSVVLIRANAKGSF